MAEWRLFPQGTVPHVSTAEFHAGRPRAAHLEQRLHRPRLERAAALVADAAADLSEAVTGQITVSDLGCGDGGLLSLLQRIPRVSCWGYDFQPANASGWADRDVFADHADVFGADRDRIAFGDITTVTEVLEHLADPHGAVRWIGEYSPIIVASSPWQERPERHDECHAWAWDLAGYQALIRQGGYSVVTHDRVGPFQLILGRKEGA